MANAKPPSSLPCHARARRSEHCDGTLTATWINHATDLLQPRVGNLLTDPVRSARAGPFGLLGPRRTHAPGQDFDALPPIDVVLLSHDRYDYCEFATPGASPPARPPAWYHRASRPHRPPPPRRF